MANTDLPPAPVPRPVIRDTPPEKTGETVTVACKLPSGLILRMFTEYSYDEPSQTGMRTVRAFKPVPNKTWTIRGTYVASAGQAYNRANSAVTELLPGGFALTYGVPKEIWDNWLHHNRETPMVQNGVVWAMPSMPAATERARGDEMRKIQSGLEPLNPERPAERMPGGVDRRLKMSILDRGEQP